MRFWVPLALAPLLSATELTVVPLLHVSVTLLAVLVAATPALTVPKATLAAEMVQKLAIVAETVKFAGPAVAAWAAPLASKHPPARSAETARWSLSFFMDESFGKSRG